MYMEKGYKLYFMNFEGEKLVEEFVEKVEKIMEFGEKRTKNSNMHKKRTYILCRLTG